MMISSHLHQTTFRKLMIRTLHILFAEFYNFMLKQVRFSCTLHLVMTENAGICLEVLNCAPNNLSPRILCPFVINHTQWSNCFYFVDISNCQLNWIKLINYIHNIGFRLHRRASINVTLAKILLIHHIKPPKNRQRSIKTDALEKWKIVNYKHDLLTHKPQNIQWIVEFSKINRSNASSTLMDDILKTNSNIHGNSVFT